MRDDSGIVEPESWTSPLVLATLILGVATFMVATIAAWRDLIREWLRHPDLRLTVTDRPPDSHKTAMTMSGPTIGTLLSADCYYMRLLVENSGAVRATDVQLYADRLERRRADGTFGLVARFLPMNLMWSNLGSPYAAIQPGAKRHCDLAHIIDPARRGVFPGEDDPAIGADLTILSFDLEVKANTLGHLAEPGIYRLALLLSSAERRPRSYVIEINHTGQWFSDERTMLSQGIGISLVP